METVDELMEENESLRLRNAKLTATNMRLAKTASEMDPIIIGVASDIMGIMNRKMKEENYTDEECLKILRVYQTALAEFLINRMGG